MSRLHVSNSFKTVIITMLLGILYFNMGKAQDYSDAVLKSNPASIDKAVQQLLQLKPLSYQTDAKWRKAINMPLGKQYGFMAEDFQQVFPELVSRKYIQVPFGKNTTKTASYATINTDALVPVLVASIQEMKAEIDQLKKQVAVLKVN